MILVGPFQHSVFYDSIALQYLRKGKAGTSRDSEVSSIYGSWNEYLAYGNPNYLAAQ